MKIQPHKTTLTLAVLLLIGSAGAYATPAAPLDTLWAWLLPDAQQREPGLGCNRFPSCPPPAAPEQPPQAVE